MFVLVECVDRQIEVFPETYSTQEQAYEVMEQKLAAAMDLAEIPENWDDLATDTEFGIIQDSAWLNIGFTNYDWQIAEVSDTPTPQKNRPMSYLEIARLFGEEDAFKEAIQTEYNKTGSVCMGYMIFAADHEPLTEEQNDAMREYGNGAEIELFCTAIEDIEK